MKILVPIKRVIDPYVNVRVKADATGVDMDNVKMAINPFCEIALEQAIRLKEVGKAETVIALSIGKQDVQESLRIALAMGADQAIAVNTDAILEPLHIAKIIAKIVVQQATSMCILGKQAIDMDNNQTGQILATLLNIPLATFISDLQLNGNQVTATREVDNGLNIVTMELPCAVTVDLRLNEPRFPTLPNILKAKQKPLQVVDAESFGVDLSPRTIINKVVEAPTRQGGIFVNSADELIANLTKRGVWQ